MILGIYCAGSLGKELCDIALRINNKEHRWKKIVFIDDVYEGEKFYGHDVQRPSEYREKLEHIEFIIANGVPHNRLIIYDKIKSIGGKITNLIDPTAIVSPTASLGRGIIITPYSTISSDTVIHDNVLIQSYIRVGHDIVVEAHSVLSSNVAIGGKSHIGRETYVGMSAVIKDELSIGNHSIIGMAAAVHRDVPDSVIVVGNPGRVVKKNENDTIFG